VNAVIKHLEPVVTFDPQVVFDTLTRGRRHVGQCRFEPPFKVELFELFDDPFVQSEFARRRECLCPCWVGLRGCLRRRTWSCKSSAGAATKILMTRATCWRCKGRKNARHGLHREVVRAARHDGTTARRVGRHSTAIASRAPARKSRRRFPIRLRHPPGQPQRTRLAHVGGACAEEVEPCVTPSGYSIVKSVTRPRSNLSAPEFPPLDTKCRRRRRRTVHTSSDQIATLHSPEPLCFGKSTRARKRAPATRSAICIRKKGESPSPNCRRCTMPKHHHQSSCMIRRKEEEQDPRGNRMQPLRR